MAHGSSTFFSTARQPALAGEPGALATERRAVMTMLPTRLGTYASRSGSRWSSR